MKEDRDNGKTQLKFDDDFLLDSAIKRVENGDLLGALTVLNKRERMNEPLADAYELYAEIYDGLELWQKNADAWFRFLDTCAREEFNVGYEGLAVAFLNGGNELFSEYYFRRSLDDDAQFPAASSGPQLRLVHDADEGERSPELFATGLTLLKAGELSDARETFLGIPESSLDHASGAGLAAMCSLMQGEEEAAEKECETLLEKYPDNVQVLTTYCAVLGAREKREEARAVAKKLDLLPVKETDDLYRIATALCETGLHAEAYAKLSLLRERLPYDENVLWFFAVAAYKTEKAEEAIEALELLTTVYPEKAVGEWYLARMREARDTGEEVPVTYYYRLPEGEYRKVAAFLLQVSQAEETQEQLAATEEFAEAFRLAFDEMEGHDEKLQLLASKVAVRCRTDALLRRVLLDAQGDELVKYSILHDLVCRNEDDSYGVVICNLYREVFTHELELGPKKADEFLQAFADVYVKCALIGEEGGDAKICNAAEDVYAALADADATDLVEERAPLAAAIYREARVKGGPRTLEGICKIFEANVRMTQKILDYMM